MRVTVSAFGDLRRHLLGGQPERELELPEGAVLADIARALDADPDELPLARYADGAVLREGDSLREGDRVELFAPIGGG
ncbi:MAG TPA: MoaD/ThiS family protein [Ktedonobacterales bacterium]